LLHVLTKISLQWRCLLGNRKGIWFVKLNGGGWHSYLSGVRYRLVYGPANATASHCLQYIQISFTFLVPAHPGVRGPLNVCCCILTMILLHENQKIYLATIFNCVNTERVFKAQYCLKVTFAITFGDTESPWLSTGLLKCSFHTFIVFENLFENLCCLKCLKFVCSSRVSCLFSTSLVFYSHVWFVHPVAELLSALASSRGNWCFLLLNCSCHNFNVLLHGVGSKRHVINDFIASKLSDVPHIVVNGCFPSLTIKNVSFVHSVCVMMTSFVQH